MKTLLLIDGNSLFHRAYHALPPLTDRRGEMVNAVFGFSNMIIKAIGEVKPTHIACAFDTMAPTFRHIEFEKYKAQRPAPPPDLYPQLPKVKRVLDAFGIAYFEKEGYEADDLLATMASQVVDSSQLTVHRKKKTVNREPITVIILSGDRDVLQLVDGNIKVQMPGWNLKETTLYGAKEVRDKYGLEPCQMVDYKSLIGDPSDNVPGISGIGPKTAASLLSKYHTLEELFRQLDKNPESLGNLAEKLKAGRDVATAAKRLVELDCDVDLRFKTGDLRFKPNWEKVIAEYEELGFKSIVAKLPQLFGSSQLTVDSEKNKKKKSVNREPLTVNQDDDQLKLVFK
jgi:DNA polymerase I